MKFCEIRAAESEEEIQKALELRRMVFVHEQHMFEENDLDEYDDGAIYLNAWSRRKDLLIGTVRCYRDKEKPNVWWGGRLAVHPDYRTRGIGVYLIRAAIETVKNQQASRFLASVQLQNIELFKKLGWEPIGDIFFFHGHPHQIMEVDLNVFHASPQSARRKQQAVEAL
ncbi:GNAT family N-acetyltransferase [Bacillus methanolicus]|uniref:MSMEG_0567/Sll0786 family nitrogen starvation N-acetyltransferase n=1 Tax=Bacillus methanolicus TaxID=1471 RepID=UPI00200CF4CA|nr:MSMEG_0567/Sll0786 family nitrogen starvation N-acetyltransferase [Bacillus methanolicus]UQD53462.1 GNAT family N-acetyltransferase [Bacillus methanolicus]